MTAKGIIEVGSTWQCMDCLNNGTIGEEPVAHYVGCPALRSRVDQKLEDLCIAANIDIGSVKRAERYLRQLAPHMKEREGPRVIRELLDFIHQQLDNKGK